MATYCVWMPLATTAATGKSARKALYSLSRTCLVISFLFGFTHILWAQSLQPQPGNEPLALTNASVINVRNGQVSRGLTVILRNGMIESAGAAAPPSGMRVIDLKGKYVLPGLIDAHTHIGDLASARRALESGVTTARDAGVDAW